MDDPLGVADIQKGINLVNPYDVDVSYGVENYPGKKNYNKMKAAIEIAHNRSASEIFLSSWITTNEP